MKKYKLVKTYPGSPKLGTIAESTGVGGVMYLFDGKKTLVSSTSGDLFKGEVEKYPEFWQQVVEKGYEVIELRDGKGNNCFFDRTTSLYPLRLMSQVYVDRDEWTSRFLGSRAGWKIHSVKRLSDGEVFTIGDKIEVLNTLTTKCSIDTILLINDEIRISPLEVIGTISINYIQKAKQPLFTTEDGVDIFEKDNYYYIDFTWNIQHTYPSLNTYYKSFKNFSTKEKAEEYVIMNKPCLSLNDFYNSERIDIPMNRIEYERAKSFVKQKLNM